MIDHREVLVPVDRPGGRARLPPCLLRPLFPTYHGSSHPASCLHPGTSTFAVPEDLPLPPSFSWECRTLSPRPLPLRTETPPFFCLSLPTGSAPGCLPPADVLLTIRQGRCRLGEGRKTNLLDLARRFARKQRAFAGADVRHLQVHFPK